MTRALSGVRARCSRPEPEQAACAVCAGQIIPHLADLTKRSGLDLARGTWEDGRSLAESQCGIDGLYLAM